MHTSTLIQRDCCPIQGYFCNRLFLTSFSTSTFIQKDCCPIQGSFCNRPFLASFSTFTLVQRDCCLIQGSFCNGPFLASFSISTLIQRDCRWWWCVHPYLLHRFFVCFLVSFLEIPCDLGLLQWHSFLYVYGNSYTYFFTYS